MDIKRMLADLQLEKQSLDEAIAVLERIATGRGKRAGRPPAWLRAQDARATGGLPKRKGRPP